MGPTRIRSTEASELERVTRAMPLAPLDIDLVDLPIGTATHLSLIATLHLLG